MGNHTNTILKITGNDLRLARIIYGFDTQDKLGERIGVTLGSVQRWEAMEEVDAKILGIYMQELRFDLPAIIKMIEEWRSRRTILTNN